MWVWSFLSNRDLRIRIQMIAAHFVFFTDVFLILQGDDLIHFCKYETMDRDTLVQASAISGPSKKAVGFFTAVTPLSISISSDCNKNLPSLISLYMVHDRVTDNVLLLHLQAGFSTTQEMCLNYMFYYPRMVNATAYCSSSLRKPVYDFIKERL